MTTLNNHLGDLLVDQGMDNSFEVVLAEFSPALELQELRLKSAIVLKSSLSEASRADFGAPNLL